jgi:hypothetical protein
MYHLVSLLYRRTRQSVKLGGVGIEAETFDRPLILFD